MITATLKERFQSNTGEVVDQGQQVYVRRTRKLQSDQEELALCSTTKTSLWSGIIVIPTRLLNL